MPTAAVAANIYKTAVLLTFMEQQFCQLLWNSCIANLHGIGK